MLKEKEVAIFNHFSSLCLAIYAASINDSTNLCEQYLGDHVIVHYKDAQSEAQVTGAELRKYFIEILPKITKYGHRIPLMVEYDRIWRGPFLYTPVSRPIYSDAPDVQILEMFNSQGKDILKRVLPYFIKNYPGIVRQALLSSPEIIERYLYKLCLVEWEKGPSTTGVIEWFMNDNSSNPLQLVLESFYKVGSIIGKNWSNIENWLFEVFSNQNIRLHVDALFPALVERASRAGYQIEIVNLKDFRDPLSTMFLTKLLRKGGWLNDMPNVKKFILANNCEALHKAIFYLSYNIHYFIEISDVQNFVKENKDKVLAWIEEIDLSRWTANTPEFMENHKKSVLAPLYACIEEQAFLSANISSTTANAADNEQVGDRMAVGPRPI